MQKIYIYFGNIIKDTILCNAFEKYLISCCLLKCIKNMLFHIKFILIQLASYESEFIYLAKIYYKKMR